MKSRDVVGGNVEKIAALFPHCVTERIGKNGTAELAIDFDKLRAELSNDALEDGEERYQFTWPDKRAASRLANEPVNLTLRPCREESVDFDTTENLYIEGDNLDVLKVLRETYLGRVKMIYIDPPYNTGNDFVYNDDFAQGKEDFEQNSGLFDADGNQTIDPMQRNTEANGRFHTDWLNMIYPRLKVARDLLADDGVLFFSIGQEELDNSIKLCSEIFGCDNFIGIISRLMKSGGNNGDFFSPNIDYILVCAKSVSSVKPFKCDLSQELIDKVYNKIAQSGKRKGERYRTMGLYQASLTLDRSSNARYYIQCPDGSWCIPPEGKRWRVIEPSYFDMLGRDDIEFIQTTNSPLIDEHGEQSKWNIYTRIWLNDRQEEGQTPTNFISKFENRHSAKELISLQIPFEFAKPSELIKYLIYITQQKEDSIILDFFSGSATTAHAVMKLNAEDGGHRKFIMVQLPEVTDEKSEARKAGYANICEIGKERIRRAGRQLVGAQYIAPTSGRSESNDENLQSNLFGDGTDGDNAGAMYCAPTSEKKSIDIGFRVLKLDSSNMEDVFYTPDKFEPSLLDSLVDNIKADRSGEDLLFQVMLDLGIELSVGIRREAIGGKECWIVDEGYLIACFDKDVNETTIEEMAKLLPTHLVIRDASAANDNVLDNFDQIIESYSNEKKITTHIL